MQYVVCSFEWLCNSITLVPSVVYREASNIVYLLSHMLGNYKSIVSILLRCIMSSLCLKGLLAYSLMVIISWILLGHSSVIIHSYLYSSIHHENLVALGTRIWWTSLFPYQDFHPVRLVSTKKCKCKYYIRVFPMQNVRLLSWFFPYFPA